MASYEYTPIQHLQHAFRVIQLHGGTDSEISCQLVHASLEEESLMPYEALSYTWGSETDFELIKVDDRDMAVTKNLHSALTQLRHPNQDRILWIDAICINQANDSEKSHQVQQMRSIYHKADQVIIWLGNADASTAVLMQSLALFATAVRGIRLDSNSKEKWMAAWRLIEAQMLCRGEDILTSNADSLQLLLRRPWFRRCWIIQEIANARRATVHCGRAWVSSKVFAISPVLVGVNVDEHCQAILELMAGPSNRPLWWSGGRTLYTLLCRFADAEASIGRDRIYSLLGIMDLNEGGNSDEDVIVADYEVAEEIVVRRTLTAIFGSLPSNPANIPHSVRSLMLDLERLRVNMLHRLLVSSRTVEAEVLLKKTRHGVPLNDRILRDAPYNPEHSPEKMVLLLEYSSIDLTLCRSTIEEMLRWPVGGHLMLNVIFERLEKISDPSCQFSYQRTLPSRQISLKLEPNSAMFAITSSMLLLAAKHQHADTLLVRFLKHVPKDITIQAGILEAAAQNNELGSQILDVLLNHHASRYQISADTVEHAIQRDSSILSRLINRIQDCEDMDLTETSLTQAATNELDGPRMVLDVLDSATFRRALESTQGHRLLEGALMWSAKNQIVGHEVLQNLIQRYPGVVTVYPPLLHEIGKNLACRRRMFEILVEHPQVFENNWLAFAVAAHHEELGDLREIFSMRNFLNDEWLLVGSSI